MVQPATTVEPSRIVVFHWFGTTCSVAPAGSTPGVHSTTTPLVGPRMCRVSVVGTVVVVEESEDADVADVPETGWVAAEPVVADEVVALAVV